jgi:hypothetical protein
MISNSDTEQENRKCQEDGHWGHHADEVKESNHDIDERI